MRRAFRGQGATEYLVLLAVVLVIALVGIALLGFFPGTASDAQIAESEIYWKSASPIAIAEWAGATVYSPSSPQDSMIYLRLRNTGPYPIRLAKVIGGDSYITQYIYTATWTYTNISAIYLAPGEETCLGWGWDGSSSICPEHQIRFEAKAVCADCNPWVRGATSLCQNSSSAPGVLTVPNFGFEYVQYIEGQQITKRQIGAKPLIARCTWKSG